jgi:hypothetical protein
MAAPSSNVPGYDATRRTTQTEAGARSGEGGGDPTVTQPQYPPAENWASAIFGGPLPTGTGAPGSGGGEGGGDPTTEPGQTIDDFTGVPDTELNSTGAPGTTGGVPATGGGADAITITRPGSYLSGSYASDTVRADTSGPHDHTQANMSGYGTDGPKLPAMAEPQAGSSDFQPGGGHVMRGGRMVQG